MVNGHHLSIIVIARLFRGRRRSSRKSLGLEDEVDLKVPPFGEFPDLSMITYINFKLLLTEMDDYGRKVILEAIFFACSQSLEPWGTQYVESSHLVIIMQCICNIDTFSV